MRVKRKPMAPTTSSNRLAPGPMFTSNSLLAWHARMKSQRELTTNPESRKTSQVVAQA